MASSKNNKRNNNPVRRRGINEPLKVVGITSENVKVYEGDVIPPFPNRRNRRYYKRALKNTNNASFNKKKNNRSVHPIYKKLKIGLLNLLQVAGIRKKYVKGL